MKKGITLLVTSYFILLCHLPAQKYEEALKKMAALHPSENIYMQLDKDNYVAGEIIWFKAYLMNNGKPGGLSSNLFVQLVNENGKAVTVNRYPVMGAVSKGSISLPDSLPQGNYYIRALTANMLNYDEKMIYRKAVPVFRQGGGLAPATASAPVVQFLPESGNLISGVLNVVAFRATDQRGAPLDISGIVKTEDGTAIASFNSYHDGIGKVQFKPQAGKKYVAEVTAGSGTQMFLLPDVQEGGISLKVSDEKGGKKIQLARGEKDKQLYDVITLVAEINNQVVYENEIAFEDYPSVTGHILTDSLPSGVLHFTVFNKDGVPVGERLSFVNNGEYRSSVTVNAVKTGTGRREENNIELSFDNPVQRSLSVAITAYPALSLSDNDNCRSHFLLHDLDGYVYNPAWYFNDQNDSTRQALDNLLLVHKKAGFSWDRALKGEQPVIKFSDPDFIAITGTVVDEKSKAPLNGGKLNILLEAEDSVRQTYEVLVDGAGRFTMDSLYFNGMSKLFYAYIDAREKTRNARVLADEDILSKSASLIPADFSKGYLTRDLKAMQGNAEINERFRYAQTGLEAVKELERVTVEAKRKKSPYEVVNEKYTTGVFRADGKENIDNINNPVTDKSMNAVDFIKNRVQQLEIQGGTFVNRKNVSLMTGQKWQVGIFIDEEISSMDFLRLLRAQDIALVKFYEAGFVGVGSSYPGGAVAVYTKSRFREEQQPDKLEFFEQKGYTLSKEFYNPDYSIAETAKTASDNRTTLYWNPDVITEPDSKTIKLRFFNNDISKKYKVVIEGFDANGRLVHEERIIGN